MGKDVLSIAYPEIRRVNFQKLRLDGFIEKLSGGLEPKILWGLKRGMARDDVWPLITEQRKSLPLKTRRPPLAIVFDSFSDLSDQQFRLKKNSAIFFSHYSDLKVEFAASRRVQQMGLLGLEKYEELVLRLLSELGRVWPNVPIVMLHFPARFESRAKFVDRAETIEKIWGKVATEIPGVFSLSVPQSLVSLAGDRDDAGRLYPYHYTSPTYEHLASSLQGAL